jgi:hypothetical protein
MREGVWWGVMALLVPFIGQRMGMKGVGKGMHLVAMVDLQCVSFRVEGEPGAETTEGRLWERA